MERDPGLNGSASGSEGRARSAPAPALLRDAGTALPTRPKPRRFHAFELALIAPALLVVALVTVYPIVYAIDISLYDTVFLNRTEFIGLRHYIDFVTTDGARIAWNSLVLVGGSLLLTVPIGMGLALLVNLHLTLQPLFRTLLIVPWVVSQVIVAMLWSWIANPQFGLMRVATDLLDLMPINFFGESGTAMASLIFVNVWRTVPFAMLLFLAALQTVPRDLHEAAEMDGAPAWRRFWEITFPFIRSTVLVVVIMLSLSYFNHIDLPLILTGGGPLGATEILALAAYDEAFLANRLGYGSAISVLVFVVNLLLSLFYIRLLRSERHV